MKKLILIFLLAPMLNKAQEALFINRGSDIYIQERALIEIEGGIKNTNDSTTGIIKNDGTIEISGDFENVSGAQFQVYNNAASKERAVKFMGGGKQYIKGDMDTAGLSSFYNLVIDKASASDTVEMQTAVTVEGGLVFGSANTTSTYSPTNLYTNNNQKGLVKTYSTTGESLLSIKNGDPGAIAGYPVLQIGGAPTTGFILTSGVRGTNAGGLQRKIASATSYVFPIGTEEKGFNGAQLNFSAVPGGGNLKGKFCEGTSNPGGNVGHISPFCAGCKDGADNPGYNRYFENNECNGGAPQWITFDHSATNHGYWSFEASNLGYEYDMEVFPNSFADLDDQRSSWRVIKHEGPYNEDASAAEVDWTPEIESLVSNVSDLLTYTKNAGCYTGSGVPGGRYTGFSHFTMGMSGSGSALPVKLIYVKADPIGKHHIKVSWATALEINNQGFEVQRSEDGVTFTKVGWVDGHNNSTETQLYSFDDRVPEVNVAYYYRLRQVDFDQHFEFSNIVQAKLVEAQANLFTLYPNPTANDVFLNVQDPVDEIKVTLYDTKGSAVYENIYPVEQNGVTQTIVLTASSLLPPGTYILNAQTNGIQYRDKVILQ